MLCKPRFALGILAVACTSCFADSDFGGHVLVQGIHQLASSAGPLAQANAMQNGLVAKPDSGVTAEVELRGRLHGITGIVTLAQQRPEEPVTDRRAWVNELYGSMDRGAWQFAGGKKIVAWDVGFGFRPNDIVQQENRRMLMTRTLEGRPLLMAEYFNASSAASFVWVNPTKSHDDRGAQEPALAARLYQRDGDMDWYGFARAGTRTGASVGLSNAWVATEAIELHGSLRYATRVDSTTLDPAVTGLAIANPWISLTRHHVTQGLFGGTWTSESQVSVLAEAWYDGAAPSNAEWDTWYRRGRTVLSFAALGAPIGAVAGNMAWQANAFGSGANLRRENVLLRLSWKQAAWEPAIDMLFTPADAGRVVTASLNWQGDRFAVQARLRHFGGPSTAIYSQLPVRRIAYIGTTWSF